MYMAFCLLCMFDPPLPFLPSSCSGGNALVQYPTSMSSLWEWAEVWGSEWRSRREKEEDCQRSHELVSVRPHPFPGGAHQCMCVSIHQNSQSFRVFIWNPSSFVLPRKCSNCVEIVGKFWPDVFGFLSWMEALTSQWSENGSCTVFLLDASGEDLIQFVYFQCSVPDILHDKVVKNNCSQEYPLVI